MPPLSAPTFTIGSLARQANVSVDTIRYYEREQLLPSPRRTATGYRTYTATDVQRLERIRRAKALGFTLDEIRDLLRLEHDHDHGVKRIKRCAKERLDAINLQLAQLLRRRDRLQQLIAACPGSGEPHDCPILSSIHGDPPPESSPLP